MSEGLKTPDDVKREFQRAGISIREWARKNKVVMRQQHQPGERGWVDFAGPTIPWLDVDPGATLTVDGAVRPVETLVAGLDASERDGVRMTGMVLI